MKRLAVDAIDEFLKAQWVFLERRLTERLYIAILFPGGYIFHAKDIYG